MRTQTPTLGQIQRIMRVQVCAQCPNRTRDREHGGCDAARACEAGCPLFTHLPAVREAARLTDPMIGRRQNVLRRVIERLDRGRGRINAGARRCREQFVRTVDALFRY